MINGDILKEKFTYNYSRIPYFTSPLLDSYNCQHLFSTRHGGVSEGIFESLNFAVINGCNRDDESNVDRNMDLAASVFSLTKENVVRGFQKHSNKVEIVDQKNCGKVFSYPVDGLVTDKKDVLLSIRTADCAPVLFFEKNGKCCGAVHSGWRGTLDNISKNAIEIMVEHYNVNIDDIIIAIGPYNNLCCYEVGDDFYHMFIDKDPRYDECFKRFGDKYHFDNGQAISISLIDCGINKNNISICNDCTCCNNDFYSHRRQGYDRGSLASFIVLK